MSKKAKRLQHQRKKERYETAFAKKSLGQNFLNDDSVLDTILTIAQVKKGDQILEIGPGLGALTEKLLSTGAKVKAIELDPRAVLHLIKKWDDHPRFSLTEGSILDVDINEYFSGNYKVVANIPYHITNPILRRLLYETENRAESLTLMVQKEVAEKIASSKGSLVQKMVELWGDATVKLVVPRTAFLPPPKVDSAVLHVSVLPEPRIAKADQSDFFFLLKKAFGQKRKMIGKSLKELDLDLSEVGPERRPETLKIAEWSAILRAWQAGKTG